MSHSTLLTLTLPAACLAVTLAFAVDRPRNPLVFERSASGEVDVQISGLPGKYYQIESSDDLEKWSPLALLQGLGPQQYTVAANQSDAQFFRAVEKTGSAGMAGEVIATTTAGEPVVFQAVNHASFAMHWQGKTIYNDPVGSTSLYRRLPDPDIILVSHQHGDHFSARANP